jgi:hypothetical protein
MTRNDLVLKLVTGGRLGMVEPVRIHDPIPGTYLRSFAHGEPQAAAGAGLSRRERGDVG